MVMTMMVVMMAEDTSGHMVVMVMRKTVHGLLMMVLMVSMQ